MNAPVFVKIDRYKKVKDVVDRMRKKLDEAKSTLTRINELKAEEEKELAAWQAEFARIESKIDFLSDNLKGTKE